jgi:hypothetical protein
MTLGNNGDLKVRYSNKERELFAFLRSDIRRTSVDLAKLRYKGRVPYHGKANVNAVLRSLTAKVAVNREPFRIHKSKRAGPHPIEFWVEAR